MRNEMLITDQAYCNVCGELIRLVTEDKETGKRKPETHICKCERDTIKSKVVCPVCGEVKEYEFLSRGNGYPYTINAICKCERDKRHDETVATLKKIYIGKGVYRDMTFEQDDLQNKQITEVCKKYVEHADEMRKNGIGMLLFGSVGSGKTFYAVAMANALIEKEIPTAVIRASSITTFSPEEEKETLNKAREAEFVVLDDFGVERDTPTATEKMFQFIDEMIRMDKPLIVTTNLSPRELTEVKETEKKRIYDRLISACPIKRKVTGESKRLKKCEQKRKFVFEIFGSEAE